MRTRRALVLILAGGFIAAMAEGCGGKQSTASRSAAEYDETQRKGIAVGGPGGAAEHGGHAAEPPAEGGTAPMAGMDHSNMPGMKAGASPAPAKPGMAGMDHSNMAGMKTGASPAPGEPSMASMDHSNMPGMSGMAMPPPRPEPQSATAAPGQPAATLRVDDIDRPSPSAVEEAARSAAMAAEMAGGGHGMSHGTYQHIDAGRGGDKPAPGGKQAPKAKPSPSPHSHHDASTPSATDSAPDVKEDNP